MNFTLPMWPVYLVDISGSALSIFLAFGAVFMSRKLSRRDPVNAIWTYLLWISIAFGIFTVFRSVSHLLKFYLVIFGYKSVWQALSPFAGAVESITLVFVATLTFYYERVKKSYRSLIRERDLFQDAKEEIGLLNTNLGREMDRMRESECKLENAHAEISKLIDQVRSGGDLSIRYRNPNLTQCWELKDCVYENCPAYKSDQLRCWHLGKVYCCRIKAGKSGRECNCEACEIYISAHKDPLTRFGERFNDMMHFLENKQKELEGANRDLQEMDKKKSKFLDIVAHDLRTPLTSILAYADLLLRYKSESAETRDEFLRTIIFESRRLGDLINDYLDISKIEAGLMEYQLEPLNFREVIDHVIAVYSGICMQKGIQIHKNSLAQDLPILGDKRRLAQVMSNLMSNASKFTPAQGKISITAGLDSNGEAIHISVSDTGPGIPETHLEEIFKKFTQLHDGDLHAVGGTGIGLSICKEIVEFHDGKIWAEHSKEGGASFHLVLPVQGPERSGRLLESKSASEG
ncbi:MAG: HAMP domain-containing sensor histidine kinase [bacterium]